MFSRVSLLIVVIAACSVAQAREPKRYADEDALWMESVFKFDESPRPQPPAVAKPDPVEAAQALACEPLVIHGIVLAWKATLNGTRERGLAESGFAVESYMSSLSLQGWREASVNDLLIPADDETVAVAHVHGKGADNHPGAVDLRSRVPNFVISQDALYVTLPGTSMFTRVRGGVNDADGWNKPCRTPSLVASRTN